MVDPLQRHSFRKPTKNINHFQGIIKMLRHELDELAKHLFLDTDIKKRKEALEDTKNMPLRYAASFKELAHEEQQALTRALTQNWRKVENALNAVPISIIMEVEGIHIPVLNKLTHKPFTLLDFLSDPHHLTGKEVVFQYHAVPFNPIALSKFFPGLDDIRLKGEIAKNKKVRKPTFFTYKGFTYDLTPSNPTGSYTVTGHCLLKELQPSVKYDIPKGSIPGDIHIPFDRILEGG